MLYTESKLILDCKIRRLYRHQRVIIKDSSIVVYSGDRIWLKGVNGVGKTSLLLALSNQLEFNGFLDKKVESLYISPKGVFFDYLTPTENSSLFGLETSQSPERPMVNLSFGERLFWEIFLIARSIDKILLVDDCFSFLDNHFINQVKEVMVNLKRTCIFASQDERVRTLANKIYEIRDFKVIQVI